MLSASMSKVRINEIAITNNLISQKQILQYVRNDLRSLTYLWLLVSDHALDALHAFQDVLLLSRSCHVSKVPRNDDKVEERH